jgi:alkylhydroperoxidase family enzyme
VARALAQGDLAAAVSAGLEPHRAALLGFVRKLTLEPYRVRAADTEALRQQGYSDTQLAEAVYITALFAFFNRVADGFGIESGALLDRSLDELKRRYQP